MSRIQSKITQHIKNNEIFDSSGDWQSTGAKNEIMQMLELSAKHFIKMIEQLWKFSKQIWKWKALEYKKDKINHFHVFLCIF